MHPPLHIFEPMLDCLAEIVSSTTAELRAGVSGRGVVHRGGREIPVRVHIRAGDQVTVELG